MPEITRNQGPAVPAKGPLLETPAPAPPGADKLAASAVATLDMEVPPQAKVPEVPDLGTEAPTNEGPSNEGPANEAPAQAEGPAPTPRSVNELAQDPAARAALQAALDNKTIKFESLRTAVQTGLETGEFNFKSPGQERVVKEIIAGSIKPAPAPDAPAPAVGGPDASGPTPAAPTGPPVKVSALEKAIANFPTGLDKRVEEALLDSPAATAAKNPPFTKGELLTAKPSVGDAVRYANAMAIKTENFEPRAIDADFQAALGRANKGSLYDLANDQGIKLYPKAAPTGNSREGGSGRDASTLVAPESKYGRAIAAAQEKGVELPAPADPEKGYTVGEARDLNAKKLIDLDSVAVARQTPAPAQEKEMAGPEDRKVVLDAIAKGVDGKAGLPKDTFMSLSNPAKNEVRQIVKGLGAPNADITSMVVTALLAKEFKDRLEKEASKPE